MLSAKFRIYKNDHFIFCKVRNAYTKKTVVPLSGITAFKHLKSHNSYRDTVPFNIVYCAWSWTIEQGKDAGGFKVSLRFLYFFYLSMSRDDY